MFGVDDLALRRPCSYATLLADLETHRPVDLLRGRDAALLSTWLRDHPGIEVIVRDRAGAYAEGARRGAPEAQQVVDRFHLLHNASDALIDLRKSRRRQVDIRDSRAPTAVEAPSSAERARPLSPTKQLQAARRAARVARWEEVQRRNAAGQSQRQIARERGLSRMTVRHLLNTPEPLRNRREQPRPGGLASPTLQPYVAYLPDRWQAGGTNISQLFREIVAQGYRGSRSLLYQALRSWRPARAVSQARQRSRRLAVRW